MVSSQGAAHWETYPPRGDQLDQHVCSEKGTPVWAMGTWVAVPFEPRFPVPALTEGCAPCPQPLAVGPSAPSHRVPRACIHRGPLSPALSPALRKWDISPVSRTPAGRLPQEDGPLPPCGEEPWPGPFRPRPPWGAAGGLPELLPPLRFHRVTCQNKTDSLKRNSSALEYIDP